MEDHWRSFTTARCTPRLYDGRDLTTKPECGRPKNLTQIRSKKLLNPMQRCSCLTLPRTRLLAALQYLGPSRMMMEPLYELVSGLTSKRKMKKKNENRRERCRKLLNDLKTCIQKIEDLKALVDHAWAAMPKN
ncbi:unnamed protein product [Lepeophtheirus salmonis]|uniref:(salmon louse) hypothetical protein n=1 Tax=Lepeophtheirus salmonis TaxID=72036 RepID=A0A7R8CYN4_LEPSM|nr:unnamed protein product [Lepeophtheirus salmonis]CAF2943093.1 unnamed protein product [Lepeophtheirus salmonis]